jgi:hypothetical protein
VGDFCDAEGVDGDVACTVVAGDDTCADTVDVTALLSTAKKSIIPKKTVAIWI